MGSPPPVDAPSLADQQSLSISASLAPSPTGLEICGFQIPGFDFNASFRLPGFPSLDFPPSFFFGLALVCDLSNPISADAGFGGGRAGTFGLEDDEEFGS